MAQPPRIALEFDRNNGRVEDIDAVHVTDGFNRKSRSSSSKSSETLARA